MFGDGPRVLSSVHDCVQSRVQVIVEARFVAGLEYVVPNCR